MMLACGGHHRLECCAFPKVLGDCCEGKFILDAVWAYVIEAWQLIAKQSMREDDDTVIRIDQIIGGIRKECIRHGRSDQWRDKAHPLRAAVHWLAGSA